MSIVSRESWGARAPKSVVRVSWPSRTEFIVHHSAGPKSQSVRSIQDFHMGSNGWSDIGYNFLVDEDGTVYEGRGWLTVGAHAPDHNRSGIGVCFIGNDNPTLKAMKAVRGLHEDAQRRAGRRLKVLGHREVYSTACPGSKLQSWINAGMPIEEENELSKLPTLTVGSKGYDVKTVRWLLGARGYEPADLYSFEFDAELGKTVNKFKKVHGLAQDEIWGEQCWMHALRL